MGKEFVIKNGLIINGTHSVSGITNDSGLTYNQERLVTEDAIKKYIDVSVEENKIYSDPTQIIFNSGGTLTGTSTLTYEDDTLSLERLKFERIEDQPIETGTTFLNSSVTWTYNNSSETFEQTELDFLYYSNGRWFEKQTGYEVFVQTKDATLGHNYLEEIGEYCKRQFTRMQPARFFSPWILEDGTPLYGTANLDKCGFNISGLEGGDDKTYNLVAWEGIFSPYTTSGSFMSHPALLRFTGTNTIHNKHCIKGFSFYNGGDLTVQGYGKDFFEFYEIFNFGGNLRFQVGNYKIGSINNGNLYVGSGTGRVKVTIGSMTNAPNIYIDGKDAEFNCARLLGKVYIGWNGTTTYDNCVLFVDGANNSNDEVWHYGNNCRSYISGCQKMYVVSGSTGSLIEGSNNTIEVRTGAENTLIVGSNCNITIQSGALKTTIIGSNNTITDSGTNTVNLGEITNLQNTNIKGILNVENTTTSTSTVTGAVTVAGGVGIEENVFVGGTLSANQGATGTQTLGINQTINTQNIESVILGDNITLPITSQKDIVIGYGCDVAGTGEKSILIGHGMYTNRPGIIAIGSDLGADRTDSILIGKNIYSGGERNIVMGIGAGCGAAATIESVVIGNEAYAERLRSVSIGTKSYCEDDNNIAIGYDNYAGGDDAIVIGRNANYIDGIFGTETPRSIFMGWNAGSPTTGAVSDVIAIGANATVGVETEMLQLGGNLATIVYAGLSGTIVAGDFITGGTSGAIAELLRVSGTTFYISLRNGIDFIDIETITGDNGNATITTYTAPVSTINKVRFGKGGDIEILNSIKLPNGTSVNNISIDSGLTGDDDSLWTTKAIQEYVLENSSSGGTEIYSDPTQVIFNSGGTLTGSSNLTYDGDILITNKLKISGDTLNITENRTITNSTDTGEKGEICWDENYIYVCIDTNTWKRTSIADW